MHLCYKTNDGGTYLAGIPQGGLAPLCHPADLEGLDHHHMKGSASY